MAPRSTSFWTSIIRMLFHPSSLYRWGILLKKLKKRNLLRRNRVIISSTNPRPPVTLPRTLRHFFRTSRPLNRPSCRGNLRGHPLYKSPRQLLTEIDPFTITLSQSRKNRSRRHPSLSLKQPRINTLRLL